MLSRLTRLASLTGVLAGVAGGLAFASAHSPPGASAGGADVARFYATHQTGARVSDLLWAASFALMLFFAGSLRTHLGGRIEGLTMTGMAGAAVLAAAGTLYFNFDYALADVPAHLDPGAAQALNVLALQMALGAGVGLLVFAVSMGLAIVRCDALPLWLGWVLIVIGVVAVTPAFIAALPFFSLWMIVASIFVFRRAGRQAAPVRS